MRARITSAFLAPNTVPVLVTERPAKVFPEWLNGLKGKQWRRNDEGETDKKGNWGLT